MPVKLLGVTVATISTPVRQMWFGFVPALMNVPRFVVPSRVEYVPLAPLSVETPPLVLSEIATSKTVKFSDARLRVLVFASSRRLPAVLLSVMPLISTAVVWVIVSVVELLAVNTAEPVPVVVLSVRVTEVALGEGLSVTWTLPV